MFKKSYVWREREGIRVIPRLAVKMCQPAKENGGPG